MFFGINVVMLADLWHAPLRGVCFCYYQAQQYMALMILRVGVYGSFKKFQFFYAYNIGLNVITFKRYQLEDS